jgi:hypothetical protein
MKKSAELIGALVGRAVVTIFFTAWVLMQVYNTAAWQFNLPEFNYPFFLGVVWVIRSLRSRSKPLKAKNE